MIFNCKRETHGTTARTLNCAETYKHGSGAGWVREDLGVCPFARAVIEYFEFTESTSAASMDNTFGDALVIKAVNFLPCDLVLKKRGADSCSVRGLEPIIGICDRDAVIGGQSWLMMLSIDRLFLEIL